MGQAHAEEQREENDTSEVRITFDSTCEIRDQGELFRQQRHSRETEDDVVRDEFDKDTSIDGVRERNIIAHTSG